jgi:hypothetical protein
MVISEKRCTIEINDAFVLARSRFFRFVIVVPLFNPHFTPHPGPLPKGERVFKFPLPFGERVRVRGKVSYY